MARSISLSRLTLIALTLFTFTAYGSGMQMDEPSEGADERLALLRENWRSKTFHWFVSLVFITIIPSISACYAIADRSTTSIFIQVISAIYACCEALFLRFPDPTGHENRTSRGTAWFIAFFYCFTLFIGSVSAGSSLLLSNSQVNKFRFIGNKVASLIYKICSGLLPFVGFIKACMSVVALLGFCYDMQTGQCNAHGIMGTGFIAYGFYLALMLVVPWLRMNNGKYSPDFYDSAMLAAWGVVNTFTEHRPWEPWSHGDYQHTSMGIIFWACGMLGLYLSRNKKRTYMPAVTLIFTGYAMSEHVQHLMASTKVHAFFGYVLMLGGIVRIIEISFLLHDKEYAKSGEIFSLQYMPSFALVLAGVLFESANEEAMELIVDMGAGSTSYILVISSCACLIQMWFLMIIEFYLRLCGYSIYDQSKYSMLPGGDDLEAGELAASGNEVSGFELDDLSDFENDNRSTPGSSN